MISWKCDVKALIDEYKWNRNSFKTQIKNGLNYDILNEIYIYLFNLDNNDNNHNTDYLMIFSLKQCIILKYRDIIFDIFNKDSNDAFFACKP